MNACDERKETPGARNPSGKGQGEKLLLLSYRQACRWDRGGRQVRLTQAQSVWRSPQCTQRPTRHECCLPHEA